MRNLKLRLSETSLFDRVELDGIPELVGTDDMYIPTTQVTIDMVGKKRTGTYHRRCSPTHTACGKEYSGPHFAREYVLDDKLCEDGCFTVYEIARGRDNVRLDEEKAEREHDLNRLSFKAQLANAADERAERVRTGTLLPLTKPKS